MRRVTLFAVRALLLAALGAAIADLPLPARSRARRRLHLIDRSDSVRRGPADAPRPEDADRIREFDRQRAAPGDEILWASFGRELAFESTAVDGGETGLAAALEGALARNPSEVILYTDGRADPGHALLLCRSRGVPVYVFPLGAARVRDARIARVQAPAGERVTVDVTVVSTFDAVVPVRMNDEAREVKLVAGVPAIVSFPDRAPGPFRVTLQVEDDCPENNEARGAVLAPAGKPRVLAISDDFPALPSFDLERAPRFVDPHGKDVVVIDNAALSAAEQGKLAAWVKDFGGGLILLGGPRSYALGGWSGTPIDEISPLRSTPDQKAAVVFVIDASGSMHQPGKLDVVVATVRAAWGSFEKGDFVAALPFPQGTWCLTPSELGQIEATGGTNIADALGEARRKLEQVAAPRSRIFLLTDGQTSPNEPAEKRLAEGRLLQERGIALTVLTVDREIEIGDNRKISDWKALRSALDELVRSTREVYREKPGILALHDHPATRDIPGGPLEGMNLTSAKLDAQIVGTVGKAPSLHPAIAFRQAGRGRVGAIAYAKPDPTLLAQSIEYVAGRRTGGLQLTVDPPVLRARGEGLSNLPVTWQSIPSGESGTIELKQILSDTWEAPIPSTKPGTLWFRCGGAQASLTIPCAPEYEALGIDANALERIASETGGRVLRLPEDLDGLPRPAGSTRRPGRPAFLIVALALVFLEMALSTFWKA